jgi:hypothetical protein
LREVDDETGSQSSRPTVAIFNASGVESLVSPTIMTVSHTVMNFILLQNVYIRACEYSSRQTYPKQSCMTKSDTITNLNTISCFF